MVKPTIAVDVDGVIADLISPWLETYNRIYHDDLHPEDIQSWGIAEYATKCTPGQFFQIIKQEGFYESVKPFEGALEAIHKLRSIGRVVYLTSCAKATMDQKREWLERHGFLPKQHTQKDLVMAADKGLIQADYLIDDGVHNLERFEEANSEGIGILIDAPHNRESREYLVALNMQEAADIIYDIEYGDWKRN